MNEKVTFYLQQNNQLFKGPALVVCYKADDNEIKDYGLTSENVLLIFSTKNINGLFEKKDINYFNEIKHLFSNEEIFVRIQSECILGMYGDTHCDCEEQRLNAINIISQQGGIFIHLPQEAQGWGLHYKLGELELQVSGRNISGKYVGTKSRDEAQTILLGTSNFDDCRSYDIVAKILTLLNLQKYKLVLISDSSKKIDSLKQKGLNVIQYSEYQNANVNLENVSEYLVKILNDTHKFDDNTIDKIIELIETRKYNGRTLSTLTSIVDKINNDKNYKLNHKTKTKFINVFEKIICGDEKRYIVDDSIIKVQNNYSCKVNSSIFKAIKKIYGKNIFDRISLEKLYYFESKTDKKSVRIRTSKVLNTKGDECIFLKGQIHVEQKTFNEDKTQIMQNEISLSKLRSFFENNNYDYVKRVEMITIISERQIPGINIYIKKLPNIDNRIMDVYGKKQDIHNFINLLMDSLNRNVFNKIISNSDYEDENFTNYNLRFADIEVAINEELAIYDLLNEGEN